MSSLPSVVHFSMTRLHQGCAHACPHLHVHMRMYASLAALQACERLLDERGLAVVVLPVLQTALRPDGLSHWDLRRALT